jgi:hypothetical protein
MTLWVMTFVPWVSLNARAPCAVCDDPIRPDQVAIEMRFRHDRERASMTVYPVHATCFRIWQEERPTA